MQLHSRLHSIHLFSPFRRTQSDHPGPGQRREDHRPLSVVSQLKAALWPGAGKSPPRTSF